MANKNHALDGKIEAAALHEFLENGYRNASLSAISKRAGITTGALYTRYKNKDELFYSFVYHIIDEMEQNSKLIYAKYMKAMESESVNNYMEAITYERACYKKLIFDHYESSRLLFCLSEGSEVWDQLEERNQKKITDTCVFFQKLYGDQINQKGIEIIALSSTPITFARNFLSRGYSKEEAESCLDMVIQFYTVAWKELFQTLTKK